MKIEINHTLLPLKICTSFHDRLLGFMFQKKKIEKVLCFPHCNSIHTLFMMQPIDVVMTNKQNIVTYCFKNVKPWKIILPKKEVYYVYELPINSCKNINIGSVFKKID